MPHAADTAHTQGKERFASMLASMLRKRWGRPIFAAAFAFAIAIGALWTYVRFDHIQAREAHVESVG